MILRILYFAMLIYWFLVLIGKYRLEFGLSAYIVALFVVVVSHFIIKLILPSDIKVKIFPDKS